MLCSLLGLQCEGMVMSECWLVLASVGVEMEAVVIEFS